MNRPKPILQAYQSTGALDRQCPTCAAAPGDWCLDGDGDYRRVPCVKRSPYVPGLLDRSDDSEVDFTEPRRRAEVD